jgi:hypothetical protein
VYASQNKKTVEVQGHHFQIRMLSGSSLRKCSDAIESDRRRGLGEMGADIFRAIKAEREAQAGATPVGAAPVPKAAKTLDERRKDRYDEYDRDAVLVAGVVDCDGVNLRPDQVLDIVAAIQDTLHEAIIDFSLPPLDPDEAAAVPKDAAAPFIVS